jgi:hypothetical protein
VALKFPSQVAAHHRLVSSICDSMRELGGHDWNRMTALEKNRARP